MPHPHRAADSRTVLGVLAYIGDLLTLQLFFLLASLPVITVLPAAVALQKSLRGQVLDGSRETFASFVRHFRWSLARTWRVALVVPAFGAAAGVSLLFWYSAGPAGIPALCVLLPLAGAGLSFYVALLAAAMTAQPEEGIRAWCRRAAGIIAQRPLRAAGSVVVLITWGLLATRLPTLLPLGSGLVPAGLALWSVYAPKRPEAATEP